MEQNQKIMEQFLKLLSENGRAGQSEDLSRLLFYMDAMNRQLNAVRQAGKAERPARKDHAVRRQCCGEF